MKKKLVIFGCGQLAELAYYYFQNDSAYEVIAFTTDKDYKSSEIFCGLPLVDFEEIEKQYNRNNHSLFIAIGYNNLNKLRVQKCLEAKSKGYKLASYISTKATILTHNIGENAFILEDNTIQPFVKIGDHVTLWSGNHVGHHSIIEDNCFIASHVVISGGVTIGQNSFIGVNATLRNHITIGKYNVIGASALILKDTPDEAVFIAKAAEISKVSSTKLRGM